MKKVRQFTLAQMLFWGIAVMVLLLVYIGMAILLQWSVAPFIIRVVVVPLVGGFIYFIWSVIAMSIFDHLKLSIK